MTFGLENTGATYQRDIQAYLSDQIGDNIEAYVDDVVVKSKDPSTLVADLEQPSRIFESIGGSLIQLSVSLVFLLGSYLDFLSVIMGLKLLRRRSKLLPPWSPTFC